MSIEKQPVIVEFKLDRDTRYVDLFKNSIPGISKKSRKFRDTTSVVFQILRMSTTFVNHVSLLLKSATNDTGVKTATELGSTDPSTIGKAGSNYFPGIE